MPALSHTLPWTLCEKDTVFCRGPHRSAALQYADFLVEDMFDYVNMGFWTVLPYEAVRYHPALRLVPAGVVPQQNRQPCPIIDYSFYGANVAFFPLLQFGRTLQQVLQRLVYSNPCYGHALLAKIDLADGYYQIPLSAHAALQLAVIIPSDTSPTPFIALALSLPMGWSQSFFNSYSSRRVTQATACVHGCLFR